MFLGQKVETKKNLSRKSLRNKVSTLVYNIMHDIRELLIDMENNFALL